jgi:hypothetical protein
MALQSGDLFVVNRAGTSYKLDYDLLKAALAYTLPAATGAALGGVKVGANLKVTADGTLSANLPGALIYKGTIAANAAPPASPASGDVWILSSAGTITGAGWGALAGTSVNAGDMLIYAGTAWDHVGSAGGTGGVTGVTGTAPITVTGTAGAPVVGVGDASATAKGVVQLADAAAITAGTSTALAVTVAQLNAAKAVYASAAETKTGTITDKSVTPAGAKANFMPLDLTTLTALP